MSARLKLCGAGWETYNGHWRDAEFVDGVSLGPVNPATADKLAAIMPVQMVDAKGNTTPYKGVADRFRYQRKVSAEIEKPLARSTEKDLKDEQRRLKEKNAKSVVTKYYSKAELERIVDTGGIAALREIAEPWNVRDRAIPELMEKILRAQSDHLEAIEANRKKLNFVPPDQAAIEPDNSFEAEEKKRLAAEKLKREQEEADAQRILDPEKDPRMPVGD